ncbi:MAG TPA: hypothetical protein PLJ62_11600 [Thermoflexales bacterium]|nr:hypothetical protein [Thermoflexales bacterium]
MRPHLAFSHLALCAGLMALSLPASAKTAPTAPGTAYPVLFVSQVPIRADFATIASTFGNHKPGMDDVGRGGDLWIRYPDGSTKNLTQAAGLGSTGLQTTTAIAVRDPSPYWDGTKAVFSMVIGAPRWQYDYANLNNWRWQIYEITGLGPADTPVITKVPNQPAGFNNISPIYASDDQIIFTSDRPRNGAAHLYPQRDEYELAPTVSGVWKFNPASGALTLLNHAPSGDFSPGIDSFGRVFFTQWDHLQRDQQADGDTPGSNCYTGAAYGTFNYSDESASATYTTTNPDRTEIFPEPRTCRNDLLAGTNLAGHTFNQFFPWTINEDGTGGEILNHLGRHDLSSYIPSALTDDANVFDYYGQLSRFNTKAIGNFFQIKEDPLHPGAYYGTDSPEFGAHASGQIISVTAPPGLDADHIAIGYVTDPATRVSVGDGNPPPPGHTGHYREPTPLSDGTLIAVHTPETRQDGGNGDPTLSRYDFRLKQMVISGTTWVAGPALTSGISKTVSWWTPDVLVSFSGNLWELNPVELRPRARPTPAPAALETPEQQILAQAGINEAMLRDYLRQNNLALAVVRNATTRDDFDFQQPYRLRVARDGITGTQTLTGTGKIYDVGYLQLFQADQLRGWTGGYSQTPNPGRRVLAQYLHDPAAVAITPPSSGPTSTVMLAPDGSAAAFVPANRAMTWQLTDANSAVVRERYWLTFQPGEIRVCGSCHGVSQFDQAHQTAPQNPPQALLNLLAYWRAQAKPFRAFVPSTMRGVAAGW